MISKQLEAALGEALREARRRRHEYLCAEHVLYALLDDDYGRRILVSCGARIENLRRKLDDFLEQEVSPVPEGQELVVQQTRAFERLMQRALTHVNYSGKSEADGGDILAGMFEEEGSHAAYFLESEGVTRLDVLNYISHGITKDGFGEPVKGSEFSAPDVDGDGPDTARNPLEQFTTDLTELAALGRIDPLIGRDAELRRAMRVLCRRRKNNPIFVGEPGVGKTALVEGLALRIVEKKVPKDLLGTRIFSLDLASVLAGTKWRGDFEERLKMVIRQLKDDPQSILFIDEIHKIVGAGATSDSKLDASAMLKPVLASGEVRCIGATTYEEYRQGFEKDRGLTRRFQKIDVAEPTMDETFRILKGLKSRYEEHHKIHYTEPALRAAAELSARHINDRFLPDKAIDVLDEAGANVRLQSNSTRKTIRPLDIEKIVAEMARIPVRTVSSDDRDRLETLEDDLRRKVFGQGEAIDAIATSIKRSRAGLAQMDKPVGSFLFTGPTGVGKTELAKQLASVLGVRFLRFDMSEYMEKHSVARLIGAPPGYIGFEQGGLLTDEIRNHPYCVLLLDEIEKAHFDVYNILLQIMDHAVLTDNQGKQADFRNVVLIMTSNAGARELAANTIGFAAGDDDGKHKSIKALEKAFNPEFRNRLDAIVTFDALPMEVVLQIVDKFIAEVRRKLEPRHVGIRLNKEARDWLAKKGYDNKMGARPLQRLIQREIENRLSDELLFGTLEKGGEVLVEVKDGKLALDFAGAATA